MKKAVFLQDHRSIYVSMMADDISKYQQINYRLNSIIKEYSASSSACIVDTPMCWSIILLKYVNKIISIDENIIFSMIKSEYGGLKIKADVTTHKFAEVKDIVRKATKEIDEFVQKRLLFNFKFTVKK